MEKNKDLSDKIINSRRKIRNAFNEISDYYYHEANTDIPDKEEFYEILNYRKEEFKNEYHRLYYLIIIFLENQNLSKSLEVFIHDFDNYRNDEKELYETVFHHLMDDIYSPLLIKLDLFLDAFSEISEDKANPDMLLKETGIIYLNYLLNATAVLMNHQKVTNESQINREVRRITQSIFPDSQFPSTPFVKSAKEYKPDVLIPSLSCAIEYKYARSEEKLKEIIDQVLIDVQGYSNNPDYKIFYAVFYVESGIWSRDKFHEAWTEKGFPNNWKYIYVEAK